ncbi:AbrB family transcriptional regulator [Bifidobacterium boum]|uniref:AbrB family transcriptional regulator n=1 Tax=Bifidobacterium boum TaxID=78343 RepID=UPI00399D211A
MSDTATAQHNEEPTMADGQQAQPQDMPSQVASQEAPEKSGQSGDSADSGESNASSTATFEPLTVTYERLRHTDDVAELHEFARRPLPDRAQQAAFSRATALLEAVAGNQHTPLDDRVFLASDMPFPNILVKLSEDPEPQVRQAVAANQDDKNWLVGRLTKDPDPRVRDAALRNPRTSWKMRLEGAQNPELDSDTLDFLSTLGVSCEPNAPTVLAQMVRRAVALNPHVSAETLQRLGADPAPAVATAARRSPAASQENS